MWDFEKHIDGEKQKCHQIEEPLEKQLWKAADKLRKYRCCRVKHVVLGLIFLKYISDAFEELYAKLKTEEALGADPEDKDEYKAENVFFVPQAAVGVCCNQRPNGLTLANIWTMQWMPSKRKILIERCFTKSICSSESRPDKFGRID